MIIRVLGTGCAKCDELARRAQAAVDTLKVEAEIVKVTDINKIIAFDVMLTPALVIGEQVKVSGRLPSQKEIEGWIAEKSSAK